MWAYVVVILLVLTVGTVQARRPPTRTVVEMAGAYLGLWVASALGRSPVAYLIIFVVWFAAIVGASYAAERATAFSLETWDNLIGGVCGIVTAICFAHMIFRAAEAFGGPKSDVTAFLENVWISREMLHFTSLKHLFGLGQQFATEVGRQ